MGFFCPLKRAVLRPEGEGVLLGVDDVSVLASLSDLLCGVQLRVLGVLRAGGIGVVPTTHQVQMPRSTAAGLGREGDSHSDIIDVKKNKLGCYMKN